MTHKIGPKGQVVIPKSMRDELGLKPGMAVDFELADGRVSVLPHRDVRSLRGILKGSGMAQRLLEDRAKEPR
jgi:AbrB family looped-hinge helix DNA binding protein